MAASPTRLEPSAPGGWPPPRTGRRTPARASLLIVVVTVLLLTVGVLPAHAAISGGWSSLGHGSTPSTPAVNDRVYTILPVGQSLYFGGQFTDAGGIGAADRAAIWNGTSWSAIGPGLSNGTVYALAKSGTTVFAGGAFANVGGDAQADDLAMWNGSHWTSVDATSFDGPVFALRIVGSTLYVGGGFDNAAGIDDADGIVAYDMNAHSWSAITPHNNPIGGTVSSIVQSADGGLYVGSSGIDSAGIDAADFLARYDLTSHVWSAVGPPGPTVSAIDNRVRGLAADGSKVYVVGDFTDAAGIEQADKVAVWDGAQWAALGDDRHGGGFFGESQAVSLYSVVVAGGHVFVGGNFQNAAGRQFVDVIAGFGDNGIAVVDQWLNVGTNADGTNGPGGGTVFALAGSRGKLYVGTLDAAFGGSPLNGHAASFRIRQPDERIAIGQGTSVGDNRYNATGAGQTKSVHASPGATVTFKVVMENDGFSDDEYALHAPGSGSGFTVRYLYEGIDVTNDMTAGTLHLDTPPGFPRTIVVKVTVGNGVHSGATRSWLVTASSIGASPPAKDAVKATVIAK